MIGDLHAKQHFLVVLYGKRRVILCKALVEPGRNFRFSEISIDDEMDVFVKDRLIHFRIVTIGRNRNIIGVRPGLEKSSNKGISLAVVTTRFKGFEGGIALKYDDVSWDRRRQTDACKHKPKSLSKFFELDTNFPNVFFGGIPNEIKVFRMDLEPLILRLNELG